MRVRTCCIVGFAASLLAQEQTRHLRETSSVAAHAGAVRSLAYSPDGKKLATSGDDGTLKLWEVTGLRPIRALEGHRDTITSLSFSPDGKHLASASKDSTVRIWDAGSGKSVLTFEGHAAAVSGVAFDPTGAALASVSRDRTIKLWDLKKGTLVRTLPCPEPVNCICFTADGTRIVSGSGSGLVRVLNLKEGKVVRTIKSRALHIYGLATSPTGNLVAVVGKGSGIQVLDLNSGKAVASRHAGRTGMAVAFRPGCGRLAVGLYGKIHLWDLSKQRELEPPTSHPSWIFCLAYGPCGKYLASGDGKGTLKLWRTEKG